MKVTAFTGGVLGAMLRLVPGVVSVQAASVRVSLCHLLVPREMEAGEAPD